MNRASLFLLTTFNSLGQTHLPSPRSAPRHLTVPIEQIISSHLFPFFIPPRTPAPASSLVLDGERFWGSCGITPPVGPHLFRKYAEARRDFGGIWLEVSRAAFVIVFKLGEEGSQSVGETALAATVLLLDRRTGSQRRIRQSGRVASIPHIQCAAKHTSGSCGITMASEGIPSPVLSHQPASPR